MLMLPAPLLSKITSRHRSVSALGRGDRVAIHDIPAHVVHAGGERTGRRAALAPPDIASSRSSAEISRI